MITLMGTTSMAAATELIFSPVFHKHPNLKVAFSEGGVGWMPYLVERADYVWRKHKFYQNIHPPWRRQSCSGATSPAVSSKTKWGWRLRHEIGIDNITWECDYPHSDSFWPKSRARAEEMLADVPDEEAAKIVELNTRAGMPSPRRALSPARRTPAGARTTASRRLRLRRGHGGPRRGRLSTLS